MKASDLIKRLEELMNTYGNLELVYSIDDEGNDFKKVYYNASIGNYDEENREFHTSNEEDEIEINAICIN